MKQSDRGIYTCVSFNKHGNQSMDIEMDVQCKLIFFVNYVYLRLGAKVLIVEVRYPCALLLYKT